VEIINIFILILILCIGMLNFRCSIFEIKDYKYIYIFNYFKVVPNLFLGISHKFVDAFQVSVLVTIDYIWLAKNDFVYKGIPPNLQAAHLSLSELALLSMAFHH
jgi:hypothetical protein